MSNLKFILACRWLSPSDQGGIAMHNGYLIEVIRNQAESYIVTLQNEENRTFYKAKNHLYTEIGFRNPIFADLLKKITIGKNYLRYQMDDLISKEFAKSIQETEADLVEFMDIHSESYRYLKYRLKVNNSPKVHIRSHTPWAILRETYSKAERRGVDGFFAVDREKFCFKHCDIITTPSKNLKAQLIDCFALEESKVKVIPNLLDTDHFKPLVRLKENEEYTFLHVGRFERAKGVYALIKAFILLEQKHPEIRLINVGKPRGEAYHKCLQLLEKAGITHKVKFTGFVAYEALPDWYAQADCVVVPPEIYESFSYTVAQAMACEKWVILSDSGGMPETANYGEFGRIFTKGNEKELVEAMEEAFLNRPSNEKARQYAINQFGLIQNGNVWLDFYHQTAE